MTTYHYEQLDDESFQHLCQALLVKSLPNVLCFPVGQPDGGRDALRMHPNGDFVVYQVKFVRNPARIPDPHRWLEETVKGEAPKLGRLIPKGAKAYYLMTNVPGTAHLEAGSIDKVKAILETHLSVPSQCWWRDDLDRRLDGEWDVKWRYPDVLTGRDALRAIFEHIGADDRGRKESALRAFLVQQFDNDREVKFKQVKLQDDLIALFVDVPAAISTDDLSWRDQMNSLYSLSLIASTTESAWRGDHPAEPSSRGSRYIAMMPSDLTVGAAHLILDPHSSKAFPRLVIEGAPGQGKSTLSQFVCQVHRARLLQQFDYLEKLPSSVRSLPPRLPIKVDLRDYGTWLSKKDPFESAATEPMGWKKSLESFLAYLISNLSGGVDFSVSDLHAIAKTSSVLLVLDALDEVADVSTRNEVVEEVTAGVRRLEAVAASIQTVVTSRPANFSNSPGFSEKRFKYFRLTQLPRPLIDDYADKWIKANRLDKKDAEEVRRVLQERLGEPHLRDLARNPMQLAILLSVVHARGVSLPDKRTTLYNLYMEYFFNREAEKDASVREHRDLLLDIHGYIAWLLHSEAETGSSNGRIAVDRLRSELSDYLEREDESPALVEEVFTDVVLRVFALVSRVVGTLEFEVQPLREYFAAKYLYETAPPSTPGNERSGSRPDRFDALSRNFYWLNVTRFYAGFYSKGELPSLAEQLQVLAEEEGYRNIRHPRQLAAALLADWVFSQNKRAMKAMTALVLDGIGAQSAFLGLSGEATSDPIVLPEGNGRNELIERCFTILRTFPARDYSRDLCRILLANTTPAEIASQWMVNVTNLDEQQRTAWIELGLALGVLEELTFEELTRVMEDDPCNPERLINFFNAGLFDFCEADSLRFETVVKALLDYPFRFYVQPTFDNPLAWFGITRQWHSLRLGLSASYANASPLNILDSPPSFLESTAKDPLTAPVTEYVSVFLKELGRPAHDWLTSLDPWRRVIETGRRLWGDRRTFFFEAVLAAGIQSKNEKGEASYDLFDGSKPLVDRARFARLKSGNVTWWHRQVARAQPGSPDAFFSCLMMMCWASKRTIRACRDILNSLINSLSNLDFETLSIAVASAEVIQRTDRELANFVLDDMDHPTPRFVVACGRRSGPATWKGLYDRYFSGNLPSDNQTLEFCIDALTRGFPATDEAWSELLDVAEAANAASLTVSLHRIPSYDEDLHGFPMPFHLARQVTETAHRFPRMIVALAESRCRQAIAERVIPIAEVARSERWIDSEARD